MMMRRAKPVALALGCPGVQLTAAATDDGIGLLCGMDPPGAGGSAMPRSLPPSPPPPGDRANAVTARSISLASPPGQPRPLRLPARSDPLLADAQERAIREFN